MTTWEQKETRPESNPEDETPETPEKEGNEESEKALRKCAHCGKEFLGEPGVGIAYCDECSADPVRPDIPL